MTADQIIALIRERIEGCEHNEKFSTEQYLKADTEIGRQRAIIGSQTSTSQRLILQGLLKEILGTEDE